MEMFCQDLKDEAMKIINYEKKEMIPLTDEEKETHENQKICYICEQEFCTDENNKKEFKLKQKVRDHCHYTGKYRGAAHSNCNLNYKIPKEIPVVFHNGSTYDYHFIIKQLVKEFKGYFECLGENTEKYITFSVPIKKVLDNDNGSDNDNDSDSDKDNDNDKNKDKDTKKVKTITCRLKFIDSYRFMQDSLSNLVDNLSEINNKRSENKFVDTMRAMTDSLSQSIDKVSKIDREISQIDKKELKNKFVDNMRSMMTSLSQSIDKISEIDRKISQIDKKEPDNKFIDSMRSMTSSLSRSIDKVSEIDNKISHAELIEKFYNTYLLCNKDLNKSALLLRKGVYPYEHMDSWNIFNKSLPLVKDCYYSKLNLNGITKRDLKHVKKYVTHLK